jgi:hypothetical protein
MIGAAGPPDADAMRPRSERRGRSRGRASGAGRAARWILLAVVALSLLVLLVPFVSVGVMGSALATILEPHYGNTSKKAMIAEAARPFTLPRDSFITPSAAGRALLALQPASASASPFVYIALRSRPEVSWLGVAMAPNLFPTARPTSYEGPNSTTILQAAARGFSRGEMAFLRRLANAPVWSAFDTVARAPAVDLIGGRFALPFPAGASATSVPIMKFAATKEMAYAGVARAAYHLARNRRDSAEFALRGVISFGFALLDNGTFLIDELIGVVIVGIGRDALQRFYTITSDPRGVRLKERYDSLVALSTVSTGPPARARCGGAGVGRARANAFARQPATRRAERFDVLHALSYAPCTNVRELVFGPASDVRETFTIARGELARYAADTALIDLIAETSTRSVPVTAAGGLTARLAIGAASVTSRLFHNPRLSTCTRLLFSQDWRSR